MGRCVFDCDEIRPLVEHALASKEWSMGYEADATPSPALFFVHDQGVYCMSNGIPGLMQPGEAEHQIVAYAQGCDPHAGASFDEWYGRSRELVGGDDFAETLKIGPEVLEHCKAYSEMHIDVSASEISVYFAKPRECGKEEVNV